MKPTWTEGENKLFLYFVGPYYIVLIGYLFFLPAQYQNQGINEWFKSLNDFQAMGLFLAPGWVWLIYKFIISGINHE
jgi:hypothetical protein